MPLYSRKAMMCAPVSYGLSSSGRGTDPVGATDSIDASALRCNVAMNGIVIYA